MDIRITEQKLSRFREFISYNYKFLYIFGLSREKEHFFLLFASVGMALCASISVILGTSSFTGDPVWQFLRWFAQSFAALGFALLLFVALIWLRVSANDELVRLDRKRFAAIPSENIFPIHADAHDITVSHSESTRSGLSPIFEILLNSLEIDKDNYYRVHAGSLDIPKLSFVSFDAEKRVLKTAICSFRDIFFTHYFCDFQLSRVTSGENPASSNSLRILAGPVVKEFYKTSAREKNLHGYVGLPNPIGITGSVKISAEGRPDLWVLQWRGPSSAADRHRFQVGYAGIIDAIPFFRTSSFSLSEVIWIELYDEILRSLLPEIAINDMKSRTDRVLAICMNPNVLFQPEFLVSTEIRITSERMDELTVTMNPVTTNSLVSGNWSEQAGSKLVLLCDTEWATDPHAKSALAFRELDVACINLLDFTPSS